MKKHIIYLLLVTNLFTIKLISQDSVRHDHYAKYAIGISPSAFVNLYSGIQLSQDFRIKKNINFSLETAYLFNVFEQQLPFKGFRLKPGIEIATTMNHNFAISGGIYGLLRYVKKEDYKTVDYIQGFSQIFPFTNEQLIIGANLGFRMIYSFSKRIFMEYGHGIGFGRLISSNNGFVPQKSKYRSSLLIDYSKPGKYPFFIFSTHINFSYRIID